MTVLVGTTNAVAQIIGKVRQNLQRQSGINNQHTQHSIIYPKSAKRAICQTLPHPKTHDGDGIGAWASGVDELDNGRVGR